MLIPLSDATKVRGDFAAGGTAALAFFKWIPWPELAACLAAIYTFLRICELIADWCRRK